MATVRFSQKLRDEILSKARRVSEAKVDTLRREIVDAASIVSRVVEPALKPYRDKLTAFDNGTMNTFFRMEDDIMVILEYSEQGTLGRMSGSTVLQTPFPKINDTLQLGDRVTLTSSYNNFTLRLPTTALPPDMRQAAEDKFRQANQSTDDARTFQNNVSKLIEHYTTLAPALKEWPALWDLLPDYAQVKHKEIREKRQKRSAKEELDLSLDKMTGTVVASKISGKL